MSQDFILNHRCVIFNVDVFNGERRDLAEEDTAEGVGDGGVDTDEREGCFELVVVVKVDGELRCKPLNGKGIVFAREVARIICRVDVGNGFLVDSNGLNTPLG